MRKRIIPFLLALVHTVTVFALPVTAASPEPSPEVPESPSSERTYTLRLQLVLKDDTSTELQLKDVYYSLYKVASMNAAESKEHYVYQLEEEFLEARAIFDPNDPGDSGGPGDPGDSTDPDDAPDPGDSTDPGDFVLDFWSNYTAEWLETMTKNLAGYVDEHGITACEAGITNANGKLTFKGLKAGLYLVLGNPKTEGDTTYYPQAALVAVPFYYVEENGWLYNVRIKAKVAKEINNPQRPSGQQIHVRKVWEGVADHPGSVNVELLRDGKPNRSATLNADNNWSYTWEGLDSGYQWTVRENPVPEDWQVSYTQNGNTFTITNTKTGPGGPGGGPGGGGPGNDSPGSGGPDSSGPSGPGPDTPGPDIPGPDIPGPDIPGPDGPPDTPPNRPRLPQTGQLWWPVPLLVAVGVPLLLTGAVLFGRKEEP